MLFRPEALNTRNRLIGEVVLTPPARSWVFTSFALGVLGCATLWASLGHYTRVETVRGLLVTTTPAVKIIPIKPGIVRKLMVREGQIVRAGALIAIIDTTEAAEDGKSAEASGILAVLAQQRISERQIVDENVRAKREVLKAQQNLVGLQSQLDDARDQISLQGEIANTSKSIYEQIAPVVERGYVSRLEFERRRQQWLSERQRLGGLLSQAKTLEIQLSMARLDLKNTGLDHAQRSSQLETVRQGFIINNIQLAGAKSYILKAPVAGRVAGLQSSPGRLADPRFPILTLLPLGSEMSAEVFAPSRAAGFLKQGQKVRLHYDAFPSQRFGTFSGRIRLVSRTILSPSEIDTPIRFDEPMYKLNVVLANQSVNAFGEAFALQPGMTLTASIILDRRPFLDWIMEPVRAVRDRL